MDSVSNSFKGAVSTLTSHPAVIWVFFNMGCIFFLSFWVKTFTKKRTTNDQNWSSTATTKLLYNEILWGKHLRQSKPLVFATDRLRHSREGCIWFSRITGFSFVALL